MRKRFRRALVALLDRHVGREVIGQDECPLMLRWTFFDWGVKAMVHYFPAEVSDRDPHDHPRSFVTLVLRGDYRDESWDEPGFEARQSSPHFIPTFDKLRKRERLRAGAIRYRPAEYMHIVETDLKGCWTLVVMGPLVREWGFRRLDSGKWWPWGKYIQRFGGVTRCDAPADTMGQLPVEDIPVPMGWTIDGDEEPSPRRPFGTTPPPEGV
jgi:hypothetical protein